ncbi:hypothetical protein BO82DRAFT_358969 [Aspergillus uvarum CBS 121591]|uniref:DUF3431 domain containing protein n=1 Tax=Aspergillus uvarum CBS 121591 TaxID=1448315 RepID=A0A319BVG7_9EURO|nr:hypothetical protein BO82DRAFT_358969 [Aspergillus uvarum CBS 121591]PYH76645.1 hypothetical protein BO82DRAFT_358969 [Aspergillus uvarum CBS 121591]
MPFDKLQRTLSLMLLRQQFRWPTRRTAAFGILALLVVSSLSWYLGGDGINPVHEQLSRYTTTYDNATNEIGLVLAARKHEGLNWVLEYCRDHGTIPFVYTTDANPAPHLLTPRTIRGREATAYLSFIIDYYDRLPSYTFFVHSDHDQWHNDLFGPNTGPILRNLRLEAVDARGYLNLRCEHEPGCPTSVQPWSPSNLDKQNRDIRAYFAEVYQILFDVPADQVPEQIGNVCCAQFAVSRARILQRPRSDYERMLRWADETKLTDSFGVGWVFEKIWHIIFGMEAIYCPRYEQCRCDAYGWCGPLVSGETLTAV